MAIKYADEYSYRVQGFMKVTVYKDGEEPKVHEEEQNLVVNMARTIVRDLVFGDSLPITKIQIGDLGLSPSDDTSNIPPPALTDTGLVRKFFEKAPYNQTRIVENGRPGILYTFRIEKTDANPVDDTAYNMVIEYALANSANSIYARKTRAVINKAADIALVIEWKLLF